MTIQDKSRSWSDLIIDGTGNTVVGWYGHGQGRGPYHLTELAILRLASTVMGEVVAHNRGAYNPGQEDKTISY